MANLVIPQLHLNGKTYNTKFWCSIFTLKRHSNVRVHTLTESCPGINCRAFWSFLGLEGDSTFKDGLSIFWDSKELEPAMKRKRETNVFGKTGIVVLLVIQCSAKQTGWSRSENNAWAWSQTFRRVALAWRRRFFKASSVALGRACNAGLRLNQWQLTGGPTWTASTWRTQKKNRSPTEGSEWNHSNSVLSRTCCKSSRGPFLKPYTRN